MLSFLQIVVLDCSHLYFMTQKPTQAPYVDPNTELGILLLVPSARASAGINQDTSIDISL